MKHHVCVTNENVTVEVDLALSEAGRHVSRNPHLLSLAKEALQTSALKGAVVRSTKDLGRVIGYDYVVEVTNPDEIFFAQVAKEKVYTAFVKRGNPRPTQLLSVVLERVSSTNYLLNDLWIGPIVPTHPGSPDETEASKQYWMTHAYIYREQTIRPNTTTRVYPSNEL